MDGQSCQRHAWLPVLEAVWSGLGRPVSLQVRLGGSRGLAALPWPGCERGAWCGLLECWPVRVTGARTEVGRGRRPVIWVWLDPYLTVSLGVQHR